MSFRKPCHMPFRKLIPSFTLTVGQMRDKTFETDVLILTEYNSDSFLNDLSIKRHWLTLISLCPTCSKSAFFLERMESVLVCEIPDTRGKTCVQGLTS